MFEAPTNFIAGQSAMSKFLLSNPNCFDVEDAVHYPQIVINTPDAALILEITFRSAVDRFDDFLQHGILRAGSLRGDRDISFRCVSSGDHIFCGVGRDVADDMVTGKPNFLRGLEGDWIHDAPTA